MILASGLVFALTLDKTLDHLDGAILLVGLLIYLGLLLRQSRHSGHHHVNPDRPHSSWPHNILLVLGALVMLGVAGRLLLNAGVELATELGLSERIIGLTVIAICTSLPELATSLIAAFRGQREIAVGNVIGSNLFNLLGVLGITALVAPMPLSVSPNALAFDLPVMLGVAVLCLPVFYAGYRITRLEGVLFLGLYLVYGLHVVSFTTGMPLATKLEHLMLFYILPTLLVFVLFTTLRAWHRQH